MMMISVNKFHPLSLFSFELRLITQEMFFFHENLMIELIHSFHFFRFHIESVLILDEIIHVSCVQICETAMDSSVANIRGFPFFSAGENSPRRSINSCSFKHCFVMIAPCNS